MRHQRIYISLKKEAPLRYADVWLVVYVIILVVLKFISVVCGLVRPRDWNAARTIFLMNVGSCIGRITNY